MVSTEMMAGMRTAVYPPPPSAALAIEGMSAVEPSSARLNADVLILLEMCLGTVVLGEFRRSPETHISAVTASTTPKTSCIF